VAFLLVQQIFTSFFWPQQICKCQNRWHFTSGLKKVVQKLSQVTDQLIFSLFRIACSIPLYDFLFYTQNVISSNNVLQFRHNLFHTFLATVLLKYPMKESIVKTI
jgi:hypothetical protein